MSSNHEFSLSEYAFVMDLMDSSDCIFSDIMDSTVIESLDAAQNHVEESIGECEDAGRKHYAGGEDEIESLSALDTPEIKQCHNFCSTYC